MEEYASTEKLKSGEGVMVVLRQGIRVPDRTSYNG